MELNHILCVFIVTICHGTHLAIAGEETSTENLKDSKHGVAMGRPSHHCDDAKTKLEQDWDGSPMNYTCFTPKSPIPIREVQPKLECVHVDPDYVPQHYCMNTELTYDEAIPRFGDHRPLWPVYGRYTFVPPQRWLHSIEHGAVVMLYHPCTHPFMVRRLQKIVESCIRKHVITASAHLSRERPLALVAWGCRLTMNLVDKQLVIKFIKERAKNGPEGDLPAEGQYRLGLIKKASVVKGSDFEDSKLCPDVSSSIGKIN